MKKISLFIFSMILFFVAFSFNVYANEQYINVGLLKYKNATNIVLDNKNIVIGKNNENTFINDVDLATNGVYSIKPLVTYSIKLNNNFYNYNDALTSSLSYKDSYVYKSNNWSVMIGNFNTMLDANKYLSNNNINGEIIKIYNSVGIYENDKLILSYEDSVAIKSNENISISNKQYRSFINIICKNNSLTLINTLNIEEYLYGVVPSEMPPSWHKEALKAQAVACRNYAYSNLGIHQKDGYDVCDSIHCQVYNGFSGEKNSTTEAINETKGILAYYNNEKINAVYSSSSGGYTDDAENVWGNNIPYLKAIKDEYEEGAKKWTRTFTFDELSSVASVGNITEVVLESSPITGRATSLTFIGTNGKKVLEREEIRTFFSKFSGGSLDSRNFKMAQSTQNNNYSENNKINNDIYAVSPKGNNQIYKNNYFVIDKNSNIVKGNDMFIVDKSNKVYNILAKENNILQNNTTYVSKVNKSNANSITFVGKGWGHGVGMSQYGANSLAKKGYKYDEILKYYYTGIDVR